MARPSLSFLYPRDDGLPDAAILQRFVDDHDEVAFELIVRRYADLVWTVCRSTVNDHHAAEDAFQATFLLLSKKAASVRENLPGWLHRVAYHSALKAHRRVNTPLQDQPAQEPAGPSSEEAELIHAELAALPDRYRLPLVLCDLEGLTHNEAATQLGWPVGSVSGRLVRAREQLKAKLLRRGIASAAVTLTLLPLNAASPLIRSAIAVATSGVVSPGVLTISQGVLSIMRTAKLKLMAIVSAGVLGLTGVATIIGVSAAPGEPVPAAKKQAPLAAKPVEQAVMIADAKQRVLSANRMLQISLACLNYESVNGVFPSDVLDPNGKPLLSWRVLILPYLEQLHVFQQFKLDEPWDSEHNKKWSATAVKAFTNGREPTNSKHPMTFFQRPTGKGTAHEPGFTGKEANPGAAPPAIKGVGIRHIVDGSSNTIFLVEAERAVEWAKPDDLAFDLDKPVEVRGPFANVIQCVLADSSVKSFAGGIDKDNAKWMIGRENGSYRMDTCLGTGWSGRQAGNDSAEAAELWKDWEDQTAKLKELTTENQQLELQLFKSGRDKAFFKDSPNDWLVYRLVTLQQEIEKEKQRKKALEKVRNGVPK
ncbi:MAG: sigma-70 family RNA polymerase sigma factor [Fimbriiglobus sp.]